MYSWEIENLIAKNNGIVTRDEFYKIINLVDNPQITDVVFKDYSEYVIKTNDGKDIYVIVEM